MNESETEPRWAASESVVTSPVNGELALLDLSSDSYYTLNGSGAQIWSMLDKPRTAPELCDTLSTIYGRPAEDCLPDVRELLEGLNANGLVRTIAGR